MIEPSFAFLYARDLKLKIIWMTLVRCQLCTLMSHVDNETTETHQEIGDHNTVAYRNDIVILLTRITQREECRNCQRASRTPLLFRFWL